MNIEESQLHQAKLSLQQHLKKNIKIYGVGVTYDNDNSPMLTVLIDANDPTIIKEVPTTWEDYPVHINLISQPEIH